MPAAAYVFLRCGLLLLFFRLLFFFVCAGLCLCFFLLFPLYEFILTPRCLSSSGRIPDPGADALSVPRQLSR